MTQIERVFVVVSLKVSPELAKHLAVFTEKIKNDYEIKRSIADNPPQGHVSLYVGVFPKKNIETVLKEVSSIVENSVPMTLIPVRLTAKGSYVAIGFEASKVIQELHERIVVKLNDSREGMIKGKYENNETLMKFTKAEKVNLKKWGYPFSFDCFIPHVTLGESAFAEEIAKRELTENDRAYFKDALFDQVEVSIGGSNYREGTERYVYDLKAP